MELDDIKRHALAARQFQVVHGEGTFTLTIPTKLQASIAHAASVDRYEGTPRAQPIQFRRELLVVALTTWSGVTLHDVLPDAEVDEPLEYSAGAVDLLLDANPDLSDVLLNALLLRMHQRSQALDTAAKN